MQLFGQLLVLALIAAVVAFAFKYPQLRERRRRLEMKRLARDLGFNFDPQRDTSFESRFPLDVFAQGFASYSYNTLCGNIVWQGRSMAVTMGDFSYWLEGSRGKSRARYDFSFLLLQNALRGVPNIAIRREGVGDILMASFGMDDIDFESVEFSRKYHVHCKEKRFAFDLLHPRMIEFLLTFNPPGIVIQRNYLCVSDGRTTWGPAVFTEVLPRLEQLLELWPRHLAEMLPQASAKAVK